MTPETLAQLHAQSFRETPRPWSAKEFAGLLQRPGAFLLTHGNAFALAHRAGPEVELLTIAVQPDERRKGAASALLADLEQRAIDAMAAEILLEVASTNTPAITLYTKKGYSQVGHRKDYYASPRGPRVSALVLRKSLV